jgi:hypothetical protein
VHQRDVRLISSCFLPLEIRDKCLIGLETPIVPLEPLIGDRKAHAVGNLRHISLILIPKMLTMVGV